MTNLDTFFRLAQAREVVRNLREMGVSYPWTTDPIFSKYRFCNVRREHDRTTRWFQENIRGPLSEDSKVLIATVAFRWFNRISTGERLKPSLLDCGWHPTAARDLLTDVSPICTGAYMIKSPPKLSKLEGLIKCIDTVHASSEMLADTKWTSLKEFWEVLQQFPYLGPFMAYEVVSDLRHTYLLRGAEDIMSWASPGPGCARGLGWVLYCDPTKYHYQRKSHQEQMQLDMQSILEASQLEENWPVEWGPWEMREVEHWACEVWKYVRCSKGGQPPKQLFNHA